MPQTAGMQRKDLKKGRESNFSLSLTFLCLQSFHYGCAEGSFTNSTQLMLELQDTPALQGGLSEIHHKALTMSQAFQDKSIKAQMGTCTSIS